MATNLAPLPIRLLCDIANKFVFADLNTGAVPQFVRGDDIEIDIGIGENGLLLAPSLANITSVTCQIFEEENDTNPPVMSSTVASASMNLALTAAEWTADTTPFYHAAFVFPNAQTGISLGGATQATFWLRIFLTTADATAKQITLLEGSIIVKDGPISALSAPLAAAFKIVTDVTNGQPALAILCSDGAYRVLQGDVVAGVASVSLSDQTY